MRLSLTLAWSTLILYFHFYFQYKYITNIFSFRKLLQKHFPVNSNNINKNVNLQVIDYLKTSQCLISKICLHNP